MDDACRKAGARESHPDGDSDFTRWDFADGSSIITGPGSWDLGLPEGCACYAGAGRHQDHCEHSSAAQLEAERETLPRDARRVTDPETQVGSSDLRAEAREILARGERCYLVRRVVTSGEGAYTSTGGAETLIHPESSRAGLALGSDASWGDWDPESETIAGDDWRLDLDGENASDQE